MSVKVIKPGVIPKPKPELWRGTCSYCGCIMESDSWDDRCPPCPPSPFSAHDGRYDAKATQHVDCATCGQRIGLQRVVLRGGWVPERDKQG